jgi:hypothetical protein
MTLSPITTWQDIESTYAELRAVPSARWLFRGHRDSSWELGPKLERVLQGSL